MSIQGKLIVLEGIDGSGKTTMINHLSQLFYANNIPVVTLRDPGGTSVSEKIRRIVKEDSIDKLTELLLFLASRNELVETMIKPYLFNGTNVLLDRFTISTYLYQGIFRGLQKEVNHFEKLFQFDKLIDDLIYLDIDIETSIKRIQERPNTFKDNFDHIDYETKETMINFYRHIVKQFNTTTIDANQELDDVKEQLTNWFKKKYNV